MNIKRVSIAGVFVLAVFGIFLFTQDSKDKTQNNIVNSSNISTVSAQDLRNEFGQAYSKEVEKTGEVVEIDMVASEGKVKIYEDTKTKVWNYNGQVPGPEIRVDLGDKVKVNFTNNLPDETTVHWHGVRVPNAMDGVPGVTQEPIQTGESFVYEFTPKDAGTFWFHPHVRGSEQLERGLYGTLIVEDEISKKYSQDEVWVIDDWRMTEDKQVDPNFMSMHDLAHDGRWGSTVTTNGSLDKKLNARPGERIRLRMVNSSNGRVYRLGFGGLDAKVIAVDGMYVKETFDASGFEFAPGNRIDVDIKVPKDASGEEFNIYDNFTRYSNKLGSIEVSGEPVETPQFSYPTNKKVPDWREADFVDTDKKYNLNARMGRGGIQWTINGKAYPNIDPFELEYDKFNKIKFVNESSRLHPMHLHGQFFKVISRNGKPAEENYFRDTVLVGPRESIEIGTVPLDKGKWLNHCHIQEHADAGMITAVEVK